MRFPPRTPRVHRVSILTAGLALGLTVSAAPAIGAICDGVSTAPSATVRTVRIASGLT